MKKPSIGPKQRKVFRDNYLAAIIAVAALLLGFSSSAQTLDTSRVRQGVYANPGYDYIGLGASKTLRLPQDTVRQAARDSGSISYKNGMLWLWDGRVNKPYGKATIINDSTFIIGADTIHIRGGNSDNSITTGSRTATGDYQQDWNQYSLLVNNLKALKWNSNQFDSHYSGNKKVFQFYSDSTVYGYPLQMTWGLKNIFEDPADSVHFELTSALNTTYLVHYGLGGSKSVEMDWNGASANPDVSIYAFGNSKSSFFRFGPGAILQPSDSLRLLAIPATTAPKILGFRAISGNVGTVVAMDIPAGGSADSTTYATNYKVDTAKANLRTQIAGKQPTGNYITALTGDVTASGPGSAAATLATTGVSAGSYTNTNITVDAKGRITAASNGSSGTGTVTQVNTGYGLTGGPITATGTAKVDTTGANGITTRSELKDSTTRLKRVISDSLIYALKSILIPSRLEFIASADTATYQDSALIGSQIMMLSIESYQVGFTTRSTSVYMSFDATTGTISLNNGEFAAGDQVIIIYRTPPLFLLDGSGNPIRDGSGNFIILN